MDDIAMTQPGQVARQDGIALWRQIVDRLQRDIGAGLYPPGGRLPTEAEMSQQFRVNRHTVRRAIEELSRGGLVRVEQGRGSFVAEDVLEYTVEPRTRFSEWIRRHNMEPSGRVLQLRETAANSHVAASLGVRAGARVVLLERLGLADDRPVSLAQHYFPATRLRGILDALRGSPTITEALQAVGVSDYLRQMTRVTARLPNAEEAELLRTPRNRPLLITENVNVDRGDMVVEFGVSRYPTPRVQIVFEP
jgi:GntR family phosphonate transport system transcriptional regulator